MAARAGGEHAATDGPFNEKETVENGRRWEATPRQSLGSPEKIKSKLQALSFRVGKPKVPPGGYDDMAVPEASPGLTARITFHRATHLPTADLKSLSSDPYIVAHLTADVPTRHKEDPPLIFRTPTIHRSHSPVWDATWIVANVPRSGFRLKMRIYDEDPANHDDRLGNAHLVIGSLSEATPGIQERELKIKKRMGSKRAWIVTGCLSMMTTKEKQNRHLIVSVDVLGRTQGRGGKLYTLGPQYWSTHFSPLIGRITGTKVPGEKGKAERYKWVDI